MSEEFGPDFISVTDEEGNEFELELVDSLEHRGITYYAMFPAVAEDEEAESVEPASAAAAVADELAQAEDAE